MSAPSFTADNTIGEMSHMPHMATSTKPKICGGQGVFKSTIGDGCATGDAQHQRAKQKQGEQGTNNTPFFTPEEAQHQFGSQS